MQYMLLIIKPNNQKHCVPKFHIFIDDLSQFIIWIVSQFYFMDNSKLQKAANVYTHHLRNPTTKKSFETSETINDSLPNIQPNKSLEKANVLRNQLNDTKSQIALMESKLNNLRKLRQQNQIKNKQNMTKIQFMTHVKQRVRSDFEFKQKIRHQKQQQLGVLKHQAEAIKESLVTQRKNAQNNLYTIKCNEAEEERMRKKHHEYLIKKLKQMDSLQLSRKVERVKQFHQNSTSRLKEFQNSRVHMSHNNYESKVISTLKEKERARSMLKKLQQEQQKILQDVKASEQVMLTSLYSLESLNPQRKKKRFNSIQKINKYDIDDYSNEQFQA